VVLMTGGTERCRNFPWLRPSAARGKWRGLAAPNNIRRKRQNGERDSKQVLSTIGCPRCRRRVTGIFRLITTHGAFDFNAGALSGDRPTRSTFSLPQHTRHQLIPASRHRCPPNATTSMARVNADDVFAGG